MVSEHHKSRRDVASPTKIQGNEPRHQALGDSLPHHLDVCVARVPIWVNAAINLNP
jgi:hypothetical protein